MIPWGRRKTDHFVFKTTAPAGNIAVITCKWDASFFFVVLVGND